MRYGSPRTKRLPSPEGAELPKLLGPHEEVLEAWEHGHHSRQGCLNFACIYAINHHRRIPTLAALVTRMMHMPQ